MVVLLTGKLWFIVNYHTMPTQACCNDEKADITAVDVYGQDISDRTLLLSPPRNPDFTPIHLDSTSQAMPYLFDPYIAYSAGGTAVRIVDIDADGLNEILVARSANTIGVWRQINGQLVLSQEVNVTASRIEGMVVRDFDNNDALDIAVSSFSDNTVKIAYQDGGVFTRTASYAVGSGAYAIAAGDLNNDHRSDIAAKGWNSAQLHVLFQNPGGTPDSLAYSAPQAGWDELEIGDVSGDDLPDIVFMSGQLYSNPNLSIYLQGQFPGTLLIPPATYDLGNVNAIAILDYDQDGLNDVAMAHGGNGAQLTIWKQQQNGPYKMQSPTQLMTHRRPPPQWI